MPTTTAVYRNHAPLAFFFFNFLILSSSGLSSPPLVVADSFSTDCNRLLIALFDLSVCYKPVSSSSF